MNRRLFLKAGLAGIIGLSGCRTTEDKEDTLDKKIQQIGANSRKLGIRNYQLNVDGSQVNVQIINNNSWNHARYDVTSYNLGETKIEFKNETASVSIYVNKMKVDEELIVSQTLEKAMKISDAVIEYQQQAISKNLSQLAKDLNLPAEKD